MLAAISVRKDHVVALGGLGCTSMSTAEALRPGLNAKSAPGRKPLALLDRRVRTASRTPVSKRAAERWSLSPLTLPHGTGSRLVVAEQLYRAMSLAGGSPLPSGVELAAPTGVNSRGAGAAAGDARNGCGLALPSRSPRYPCAMSHRFRLPCLRHRPRRRQLLLQQIGVHFQVLSVDSRRVASAAVEAPVALCLARLAEAKAGRRPRAPRSGPPGRRLRCSRADTAVVTAGAILGKPADQRRCRAPYARAIIGGPNA